MKPRSSKRQAPSRSPRARTSSSSFSNRLRWAAHAAPLRLALDHVALLGEDEHVVAVGRDVREPDAEQVAQLALGRRLGGEDLAGPLEQRVEQLVADADQQLVLALDVVVEAAGGEPGRLGQVAHRGLLVAALGEEAGGGRDHLAPLALVALAQRRPGRRARRGSRAGGAPCGPPRRAARRRSPSREVYAKPNDPSKLEGSFGISHGHGLRPLRRAPPDPEHRPRLRPAGGGPGRRGAGPREALPLRDRRQARRPRPDGHPLPRGVRGRGRRLARLRDRRRGADPGRLLGRDHALRPHLARHPADPPVRQRGAEAGVDAAALLGAEAGRLRADRAGSGLGRRQRPHPGAAARTANGRSTAPSSSSPTPAPRSPAWSASPPAPARTRSRT